MKQNQKVFLDTYVIQKDMRIRLPKEVLRILDLKKGNSFMDVYVDAYNNQILLKPSNNKQEETFNEKRN